MLVDSELEGEPGGADIGVEIDAMLSRDPVSTLALATYDTMLDSMVSLWSTVAACTVDDAELMLTQSSHPASDESEDEPVLRPGSAYGWEDDEGEPQGEGETTKKEPQENDADGTAKPATEATGPAGTSAHTIAEYKRRSALVLVTIADEKIHGEATYNDEHGGDIILPPSLSQYDDPEDPSKWQDMFKEVSVVMSPRLHQVMVCLFEGLNDIQAQFQAEHTATGLNKPLWFLHREITPLERAALKWFDPDSYIRILGAVMDKPFKPKLRVRPSAQLLCTTLCPPLATHRPPPIALL